MGSRAWRLATLLVALSGLLAATLLDRLAPPPSADVERGSEDAFVSGLEPREFLGPLRVPARWTGASARVRFRNVPTGPRSLEVVVQEQRGPLVVVVDGAVLGALPPGTVRIQLPASARSAVSLELRATTFSAGGGRTLGVRFGRVTLHHERAGAPAFGLVAAFVGVALGVLAAAAAAGLACGPAAALAVLSLAVQAALLLPMGLLRSDYSFGLPVLILTGAALACAFARWRVPLAFTALLSAWLVQAVVLTSPMVVTSDAVMHANKLMQVARGDFFPTSRTQHAPPMDFPYGVSFYALLLPLVRLGFEPVALVRYAAGISGALAAVPLFLLCERAPARAALAVVLLQLFPVTADLLSYGNLSNVFSQSLTLAFLAWWRTPKGGAVTGALLLALAALAHLSSTVVLAVLVAVLLALDERRRPRVVGCVMAAALVVMYYLHFLPLVLQVLPRLAEGASAGGRSLGLLEAMLRQLQEPVGRWGLPMVLLAAAGLARGAEREPRPLLAAAGISALALAVVACVSPLEVRFVYAVAFAVAIVAADGLRRLSGAGRVAQAVALGLLTWQVTLAVSGLREILLERYRPHP